MYIYQFFQTEFLIQSNVFVFKYLFFLHTMQTIVALISPNLRRMHGMERRKYIMEMFWHMIVKLKTEIIMERGHNITMEQKIYNMRVNLWIANIKEKGLCMMNKEILFIWKFIEGDIKWLIIYGVSFWYTFLFGFKNDIIYL